MENALLLVGKRSPVEVVKCRNVVDRLDRLLDAPEIGTTSAMAVHGGVGAEKRRRCERVALGAGGGIQRPGGRTPVRFRHSVHEHLTWARGAYSHAIGKYGRTLRDGRSAVFEKFRQEPSWATEALTANARFRVEVQHPPTVHDVPLKALEQWRRSRHCRSCKGATAVYGRRL